MVRPDQKPKRKAGKSGHFLLVDDLDWMWAACQAVGGAQLAAALMIYRACRIEHGREGASISYQRVAGRHGISWDTWNRVVCRLAAVGLLEVERHAGKASRARLRHPGNR
jgi:hypothetical protein